MTQNNTSLDDVIDILVDNHTFNQIPSAELRDAAPYFGIIKYREGQIIFKEGDKGTFMGIVHEGRVAVNKTDWNRDTVLMGIEGPGRAFGEMAVLDGEPRSASCVAETDCVILTLDKKELDNMLEIDPRVGAKVLRAIAISLSRRMRFSAGRLVDHLEPE